MKIWLPVLGKNDPDVARSYNNIGNVYNSLGEFDKALDFYQMALKIQLPLLGENHPNVATSYNNNGSVYKNLKEFDKALDFYQKALNIRLKVYGKDHPKIETVMEKLILCAKEPSPSQSKALGEISVFCTQILGAQHPLAQELAELVK